ncbi:MarR family winged helix-turn-helix transcriptional regulator [Chelativorans salis]|uniref:MarR family transcriptional regulator n=1 Tax=Chelativorans salis TaxID=2978478 RepID=A0ABT2LWW9_9HYPH|nr:MarR family transcriptional regulator [Chelativorans sp. EGI FJ00035]MCT7378372.1 MarR family transcriptional regulator [Chelativorans sp. EGI FJ00035]
MTGAEILPVEEAGIEDGKTGLSFGKFERSAGFLLRIAQLTVFERMFAELKDGHVKIGEFTILLAIAENPGVRQGAMADVLKIKWSNMTKLVRSLEERGLVERFVPPHDRRSVELRLTEEGRKLLETFTPLMFEADRRSLPMLSDEEHATFLALLRKVSGWPPL